MDKKFNLIVVDAGASKKAEILAQQLSKEYDINLIQCHKKRNIKSGQIEKLEVYSNDLQNLPNIIVDDIADGASSFIFCVKELQKIKGYKNSYLIVTHGIFSKGFEELSKYFDGIYCTNSYSDILKPMEKGTMSGVHTNMKKNIINRPDNEFVKQLNIF